MQIWDGRIARPFVFVRWYMSRRVYPA